MGTDWRFPIRIAVALVESALVLRVSLGRAVFRRRTSAVAIVSFTVVVLGMILGRYGAQAGLPWWICYPVPGLVTLALPPAVFRPGPGRTAFYLVLAVLSAPLIQAAFSLLLGWDEYTPFLPMPSLGELLATD